MVSAMTSYSSWRHGAFLFLGNIRLKAISNSHQWPKHSWRAVFSSSAKQCLLSVNLKPFLMQTEQQTQERRIVNPRRGRFDTEKSSGARTPTSNSTAQATKMETATTNSGAERTSLNGFRMLKFFKSKWKRFWIISIINIWANIAVTKHTFCSQMSLYRIVLDCWASILYLKMRWNAFTLGFHCPNCSHSSEKYLWIHV